LCIDKSCQERLHKIIKTVKFEFSGKGKEHHQLHEKESALYIDRLDDEPTIYCDNFANLEDYFDDYVKDRDYNNNWECVQDFFINGLPGEEDEEESNTASSNEEDVEITENKPSDNRPRQQQTRPTHVQETKSKNYAVEKPPRAKKAKPIKARYSGIEVEVEKCSSEENTH